jgi:uncharacterized membrane protein YraQ (UPF0718 family)
MRLPRSQKRLAWTPVGPWTLDFLIGVGVAAFIKTFQWDLKLRAYMRESGRASIALAVFLGVFSPLCACGVLPIVLPLAVAGVPLPPLLALLATSPLMSPDAFAITWAGLGPSIAWAKLISAVGMGSLVGSVTYLLEKRSIFTKDIIRIKPVESGEGDPASAIDIACANEISMPTMAIRERESKWLFFLDRARDTSLFIGKFLVLAVAIQVVMEMFLPMETVIRFAGRPDFSSLIASAFLGVPLPAHQVPVVPILSGLPSVWQALLPPGAFTGLSAERWFFDNTGRGRRISATSGQKIPAFKRFML